MIITLQKGESSLSPCQSLQKGGSHIGIGHLCALCRREGHMSLDNLSAEGRVTHQSLQKGESQIIPYQSLRKGGSYIDRSRLLVCRKCGKMRNSVNLGVLFFSCWKSLNT